MKKSVLIGIIIAAVVIVGIVIGVVLSVPNNNNGGTTTTAGAPCKHDDPSKIVVVEAVAPTCQETGLTEGMKCTLCDTMVVPQSTVQTIECIESDWIIDLKETQTEDGKRHTECTICGFIFKEEILVAVQKKLTYKLLSNDTYEIIGISEGDFESIVIPSVYNGKAITSIGARAFENCSNIKNVEIPDSVTKIGYAAFSGCASLKSIEIPNSLTFIGSDVFNGCYSLEYNKYENGFYLGNENNPYFVLVDINKYIGTSYVKTYNIHNDTKIISPKVFQDHTFLRSVTIGESVTIIGDYAFSGCGDMGSITIPNSVTSIGGHAFKYCTGLSSITIPNSVTSIGSYPFYGCHQLTNVYYEGTVEQWNAISKGENWNFSVPATEVICSDGVVSLK